MTAVIDGSSIPTASTIAPSDPHGSPVASGSDPLLFRGKRQGHEPGLRRCDQACCANITREETSQWPDL